MREGTKVDSKRSAADYLPVKLTLSAMRDAVQACRGCELYKRATQAVFGEGTARARIMLVGEQPGDVEDIEGQPFVGPAGKLLQAALDEAGIGEADSYVTNAVKHFKWTPRGKKRLHAKPSAREASACRPWLASEIAAVKPAIIVCLGATASQSLLGASFRLTKHRGEIIDCDWGRVLCTYHPSAVLRAPDKDARSEMRAALVADLKTGKRHAARAKAHKATSTVPHRS